MDRELLNQKLNIAYKHLEELEKVEVTLDKMKNDIDTYSKVYFLYQNVIERCLGIAILLIKENDITLPNTAKETFIGLAKADIISLEIAESLSGAYGFRNVIVHDYDEIRVHELVTNHKRNLQNLRNFLKEIANYLK